MRAASQLATKGFSLTRIKPTASGSSPAARSKNPPALESHISRMA
jgi:hypothetical protein